MRARPNRKERLTSRAAGSPEGGKRDLRGLLAPRSLCVVGASADPDSVSGRPLAFLARHGFAGEVVVVNPRRTEVSGFPSYPSVADLPVAVDLAVICVRAELVPDVVEQCGRRGVLNILILSSGFEESPGGRRNAQRIKDSASRYGLNIVGPNSEGLWNLHHKLVVSVGSAANRDRMIEGPVSVLSQSGSIAGASARFLQDSGIGCRHWISVGNESVLTIFDYLDYIIEEGESKLVLLYIEGLRDGWRLPVIASRARQKGVQFVALRAGKSSEGRKATESHTGKVASAAEVYASILSQCGVIQVDTVSELLMAAATLAVSPRLERRARGGVGVLSLSGGSRGLICDAAAVVGVPLSTFSRATVERISSLLPPIASFKNPVDPSEAIVSDPPVLPDVVAAIAADAATEAILVQFPNWAAPRVLQESYLSTLGSYGVPVVAGFLTDSLDITLRDTLLSYGVIPVRDPVESMRCLKWLYQAREWASPAVADWPRRRIRPTERRSAQPSLGLEWSRVSALLRGAGLDVAQDVVVHNPAVDRDAAEKLNFPLVVKALPEDAAHKTELGLVKLRLRTADELWEAVASIRQRLGGRPVLVQEMVTDAVETLLAARDDPDFGPVLAIGSGGTRIELTRDLAFVPLPTNRTAVLRALRGLKLRVLLDGYRTDNVHYDVKALVAAALDVGELYLNCRHELSEIELNPVLVRPAGKGAVVVDAFVAPTGGSGL
jgi:acetate---CoA ligase (ADP-forming)